RCRRRGRGDRARAAAERRGALGAPRPRDLSLAAALPVGAELGTPRAGRVPTVSAIASEAIEREARTAGLRDFRTPSLETVERRRVQLWAVALVVLIFITAVMVLLSLFPNLTDQAAWLPRWVPRVGVLLIAVAFVVYAIEKELHLRRLTRML